MKEWNRRIYIRENRTVYKNETDVAIFMRMRQILGIFLKKKQMYFFSEMEQVKHGTTGRAGRTLRRKRI